MPSKALAVGLFIASSYATYTCQNISTISGIVEVDTFYISNATSVAANITSGTPVFCDLQAVIGNRINVWVRLPEPSAWNNRFVQFGCGGACGYNPFDEVDPAYGGPVSALGRGFAVSTTDMGVPNADSNYLPFHNNFQMRIDWGHLATHLTAILSKQLMEAYYNHEPSFSYHLGGSTGGRQGLVEAQRYPEDFNGIVAVAPAYNETGVTTYQISWNAASVVQNDSNLTPTLTAEDALVVKKAVLEACDGLDNLKDGIISLPRSCHFNLSILLCTNTNSTDCLTPSAVTAAKKLYSGPRSSNGTPQVLEGLLPGSEAVWNGSYISTVASEPSPWYTFATSFLSYYAFWPDPESPLTPSTIDLDDPELLRQTSRMESLEYGGVADISKFAQLGGKILMFQGLIDTAVAPWFARDYMKRVGYAIGVARRNSMLRLFEMPGVEHVSGGPGADTYDSLTVLVGWVEGGVAPDRVVAAHVDDDGQVGFQRPLFGFPRLAVYRGGDVRMVESFDAVDGGEGFWSL